MYEVGRNHSGYCRKGRSVTGRSDFPEVIPGSRLWLPLRSQVPEGKMRHFVLLIFFVLSGMNAQALTVERIYEVTPQYHKEIGVQVDVSKTCTASEARTFVDILFPEKLDSGTFAYTKLIATKDQKDVLWVDITSAVHQDSKDRKRLIFCADKEFLGNLHVYLNYRGYTSPTIKINGLSGFLRKSAAGPADKE